MRRVGRYTLLRRAVQIQLFTVRVLCRVSYRVLDRYQKWLLYGAPKQTDAWFLFYHRYQ